MIDPHTDVLFLGAGTGASNIFYYRCLLPATALHASYCGLIGEPPKVGYATGLVHGLDGGEPQSAIPDFRRYKLVVMQQPHGEGWRKLIRAMRANGQIVLYEVDDYLHGIEGRGDHDYASYFTKQHLRDYEACMRECDGMIVSTSYIAERYARHNKHIYLCENGLDLGRYHLTRPPRPTVNIIWAGATGHRQAIMPWLDVVGDLMMRHPNTCFVTVGANFAEYLRPQFGNRALAVPFCAIEQYPAAMTMGDIALAPAGTGAWYRGKSDLRWLEAGALAIPTIADALVYPKISNRTTGFKVRTPTQMRYVLDELIRDAQLRTSVGLAAREYVYAERSIQAMSQQWLGAFAAAEETKAQRSLDRRRPISVG